MGLIKFDPTELGLKELEDTLLNNDWLFEKEAKDGYLAKDYSFAATFVEGDKSYPIQSGEVTFDKDVGDYVFYLIYQDGWYTTKQGIQIRNTTERNITMEDLKSITWDPDSLTLTHII